MLRGNKKDCDWFNSYTCSIEAYIALNAGCFLLWKLPLFPWRTCIPCSSAVLQTLMYILERQFKTRIQWTKTNKHSNTLYLTSDLDGNCSGKDKRKAFRDENGRQY